MQQVHEGAYDFTRYTLSGHRRLFNGFTETSSKQKWLEVHGESHWSLFSSGYGVALQKRFFDYFLKGIENAIENSVKK
jgi:hypothetical protein